MIKFYKNVVVMSLKLQKCSDYYQSKRRWWVFLCVLLCVFCKRLEFVILF